MEVTSRLVELPDLHPRLVWNDIMAAAVAVLEASATSQPFHVSLAVEGLAAFDDETLSLTVIPGDVSHDHVTRLRRTYESTRLVEMAAIAMAGLALFHVAHLEIRDIALRGSHADYLVGESGKLLEIGGRTRRSDFATAWQEKWYNLLTREGSGFFLCVVEFETPAGRLAYRG